MSLASDIWCHAVHSFSVMAAYLTCKLGDVDQRNYKLSKLNSLRFYREPYDV